MGSQDPTFGTWRRSSEVTHHSHHRYLGLDGLVCGSGFGDVADVRHFSRGQSHFPLPVRAHIMSNKVQSHAPATHLSRGAATAPSPATHAVGA